MEKIQIKNQSTLLGIDVGSTTIKVVLFKKGNLVYSTYERHYSMVRRKALEIVKRLKDEMGDKVSLQRYKGLGEMDAQQLWDTTMNPETRTLLQVTIDNAMEADKYFEMLMGDEVEPRKRYIMENAQFVRNLDIA